MEDFTRTYYEDFSIESSPTPYTELSFTNGSRKIEYSEFLYDVPVGFVILLSLFYGCISVLAVIGNSLVIWIVATTKQMQTVTNLFIANLALADVTIGMFAIPFQFQAALLQRWHLPEFMCPFCPFIQILTVNVSVFTLTAIAVDRHRAILNPLRARTSKHISKAIIGLIWAISIIFACPIAIALRVVEIYVEVSDNEYLVKFFCDNENLEQNEILMYRYALVFMQYVIPLTVISFVYIQMAIRLWGSKTPGNAQDARDINLLKNKKKVIKMLVIVVVIFGLCWLPLQCYNFLHVTWPEINQYRYINIIFFCCDWLAMSNSCYNPFIYGIYNEKFKREFRKRFGLWRFRHNLDRTNSDFGDKMSMHTRVSSLRSSYTINHSSYKKPKIYTKSQLNSKHTNNNNNNNKSINSYIAITKINNNNNSHNNNSNNNKNNKAMIYNVNNTGNQTTILIDLCKCQHTKPMLPVVHDKMVVVADEPYHCSSCYSKTSSSGNPKLSEARNTHNVKFGKTETEFYSLNESQIVGSAGTADDDGAIKYFDEDEGNRTSYEDFDV